jgi:heme exporter protein C
LHQGSSISVSSGVHIATPMIVAMLLMLFACWFYCIAVVLTRVQAIILERERETEWVQSLGATWSSATR